MDKIRLLLAQKTTLLLIGVVFLVLIGGILLFQKITAGQKSTLPPQEIEISFDPDGPYALLEPRRDGNALILNLKRVSAVEEVMYEMPYQTEVAQQATQGTVKTEKGKTEYSQEILFGTCSKGDTFSTLHCVFDKGVENGNLNLKMLKEGKLYKIGTAWKFQKPNLTEGLATSADGKFSYKTTVPMAELELLGYTIINDLSGAPKVPNGKQFEGKVYALNIPTAKQLPKGVVKFELLDNPPAGAQIAQYIENENQWRILDTKVENNVLTTSTEQAGIFAILVDESK